MCYKLHTAHHIDLCIKLCSIQVHNQADGNVPGPLSVFEVKRSKSLST